MTINSSPAFGTSDKPITSTGIEGPAFLTFLPISSSIPLTLPKELPAKIVSPGLRKPDWTKSVVTGPRPLSSLPSTTMPLAGVLVAAFNSSISA